MKIEAKRQSLNTNDIIMKDCDPLRHLPKGKTLHTSQYIYSESLKAPRRKKEKLSFYLNFENEGIFFLVVGIGGIIISMLPLRFNINFYHP